MRIKPLLKYFWPVSVNHQPINLATWWWANCRGKFFFYMLKYRTAHESRRHKLKLRTAQYRIIWLIHRSECTLICSWILSWQWVIAQIAGFRPIYTANSNSIGWVKCFNYYCHLCSKLVLFFITSPICLGPPIYTILGLLHFLSWGDSNYKNNVM